jgi:hypothetical protein
MDWLRRRGEHLDEAFSAYPQVRFARVDTDVDRWANPRSTGIMALLEQLRSGTDDRVVSALGLAERECAALTKSYGAESVPDEVAGSPLSGLCAALNSGIQSRNKLRGAPAYVRTIAAAAHLHEALAVKNTDLILCPNDYAVRSPVQIWLRDYDPSVPRPPVLSFDNLLNGVSTTYASLDFGYAGLGYRAFHFISGIVPVKADGNGVIEAEPFVVRPSLNAPD